MSIGVVVMAYGTPASAEDLAAYYTHIRRGRPPTEEQLRELRGRYDAIGGMSPLRRMTEAQRDRIAGALGDGFEVALGYKHTAPFIEDAVTMARDKNATEIVGVVLAPHDSRGSIGEYVERLGPDAKAIRSWHTLPEWRAFQANAVRAALTSMPSRTHVVFTAHSLPERVLEGDVYVDELQASAEGIAARAGLDRGTWSIGWQSASRTPEPWRGPDIADIVEALAAEGVEGVLVCPQGFTADHLEVLYDIDVVARRRADDVGLRFGRTAMLNDDAEVLTALAAEVRALAG
ncbi:MAG TPA: ferrochelatase [Acidimicrobiales bacterium]|nr:ferrochelatase [Acidimicrobiales bacterium]